MLQHDIILLYVIFRILGTEAQQNITEAQQNLTEAQQNLIEAWLQGRGAHVPINYSKCKIREKERHLGSKGS